MSVFYPIDFEIMSFANGKRLIVVIAIILWTWFWCSLVTRHSLNIFSVVVSKVIKFLLQISFTLDCLDTIELFQSLTFSFEFRNQSKQKSTLKSLVLFLRQGSPTSKTVHQKKKKRRVESRSNLFYHWVFFVLITRIWAFAFRCMHLVFFFNFLHLYKARQNDLTHMWVK